MDPNMHIYSDLEENIPAEDKARLDGYLHAKVEQDLYAQLEAKKTELEALVAEMRAEENADA